MLRDIHGNESAARDVSDDLSKLLTHVGRLEHDIVGLVTLQKSDSGQGTHVTVPNPVENGDPVEIYLPISSLLEAKRAEINDLIGKMAPLMEGTLMALGRLVKYGSPRAEPVEPPPDGNGEPDLRVVGGSRPDIEPSDTDVHPIGPREPDLGPRERLEQHLLSSIEPGEGAADQRPSFRRGVWTK